MKWIWVLFGLAGFGVQAQEVQPMPSRGEFIEQRCLPAMVNEVGDTADGKAFARAACECSYRLLSDRTVMTAEQFKAAATVCQYEFEQDNAGFVRKYSN